MASKRNNKSQNTAPVGDAMALGEDFNALADAMLADIGEAEALRTQLEPIEAWWGPGRQDPSEPGNPTAKVPNLPIRGILLKQVTYMKEKKSRTLWLMRVTYATMAMVGAQGEEMTEQQVDPGTTVAFFHRGAMDAMIDCEGHEITIRPKDLIPLDNGNTFWDCDVFDHGMKDDAARKAALRAKTKNPGSTEPASPQA